MPTRPKLKKPHYFGVIDIVAISWKGLTENLKLFAEFTAWSVLMGLFLWLATMGIQETIFDKAGSQLVVLLMTTPFWIIFSIIGLGFIDATWKALNRKKPNLKESIKAGLHMIVPFVWLTFLTSTIFIALPFVVFGLGFMAVSAMAPILATSFLIYGIAVALLAALAGAAIMIPLYYSVPLYFTLNYLMIDNLRGLACIKRCALLIRGRWWRTLWRLVVPMVFFYLGTEFILKLAFLLMGSLAGDPGLFFGAGGGFGTGYVVRSSLSLIVRETVYGLSAPLFIGASLVVWNDLKRLEGKE